MPESGAPPGCPVSLRLLLFIDGLGSGGAQRQFAHLAIGLHRRGHEVTVAVYNDQDHFAGDIAAAGIEIVRLARSGRFSLAPVLALARLYRTRSFSSVIAFLRSPAIMAELAKLIEPRMVVIAAERSAYPALPLPFTLRMAQRLHHLARFITVNSAHQALLMKQEFPSLSDRIVVIRNGVDLPPLPDRPTARTDDGGKIRLLAISSLMPYKNSIRLAEAIALLRDERGLRVSLSWLGETFASRDGDYGIYEQTRNRLRELGLDTQWRWLGVTQDVPSVLCAHDALVHPSQYEGTSNAVCEAMAMGLPVLAGAVADHEDMLEKTGAGILFDPMNARSIADAIARFAALSPAARREMGDKGRAEIQAHYAFDCMISTYERLALAAGTGGVPSLADISSKPRKVRPCAE